MVGDHSHDRDARSTWIRLAAFTPFVKTFECSGAMAAGRGSKNSSRKPQTADQPSLLEELLILELELRRAGGERPGLGEYRDRFPTGEGRVEAAFAQAAGASRASSQTLTVPSGAALARQLRHLKTDSIFEVIGDYELLEEIARGGMGVVYKARQRSAKRLVALKMILTGQMASPDERERFLREAELAANLDHTNIVPIFDVDEFQGCPFFSMKLIEGENLSRQIKAKKRAGQLHDPQIAAASDGDDRSRRPLRTRTRIPPLRFEAVEYPAGSRWATLRHRLWPGEAGERGQLRCRSAAPSWEHPATWPPSRPAVRARACGRLRTSMDWARSFMSC